MTAPTQTPTHDRVRRYRDFLGSPELAHGSRDGELIAEQNALEALEAGETDEAAIWADLALLRVERRRG